MESFNFGHTGRGLVHSMIGTSNVGIPPNYEDISELLPSRMIPYPEGTRIYARPYNYEEVEGVSKDADRGKGGFVSFERVLGAIIVRGIKDGKELEQGEVTISDFLFILFYLKVLTLGAKEFTVVSTDPESNRVVKGVISLEDIEFKDMSILAESFPIHTVLGASKTPVQFRPVTVEQYIKYAREYESQINTVDSLVISSGLWGDTSETGERLIREASGKDANTLRHISKMMDHSLKPLELTVTEDNLFEIDENGKDDKDKPNTNITNRKKNTKVLVELDDPSTLVLPFLGVSQSSINEVSFG